MKFSQKQMKYLAEEWKVLKRVIEAKQASECNKGLGSDLTKFQTIDLLIKLQSLEMNNEESNSQRSTDSEV